MKKFCLALLCLVLGKVLSAQYPYYTTPASASENIFNYPSPSTFRTHFDFILPNSNKLVIQVYNINQLKSLPDLDSLVKKIWSDLEPLRDSLSDPLMIRRIDYVSSKDDNKIRIKKYTPSATYFSYKDDELVQMKVDQDTLRFKGFSSSTSFIMVGGTRTQVSQPYIIMLLLNNISDITKLPAGILQSGLTMLRQDMQPYLDHTSKKNNYNNYYALYNLQQQKRISPVNMNTVGYTKSHGLQPYIQVGVQYGRSAVIPSVGAGLEYYYGKTQFGQFGVRLMWEPYFFFQRNNVGDNKLTTARNDFISLKFHSNMNYRNNNGAEFNLNFSAGYLIHRKGDWFEKNTFKFSLPGLQYRNALLEPEFFFNKFFQNFSPSLKLTVYFE